MTRRGVWYAPERRLFRMNADKQRAYRDRRRGGPPRQPQPCGTLAAVRRHQRRGEPLDDACREAYNAEQRRLYAQRRR